MRLGACLCTLARLRRGTQGGVIFEGAIQFFAKNGEMSEWPKEHAWKVCIPQGIEGSTPSLTAIFQKN